MCLAGERKCAFQTYTYVFQVYACVCVCSTLVFYMHVPSIKIVIVCDQSRFVATRAATASTMSIG